jgi:hypothetical protein
MGNDSQTVPMPIAMARTANWKLESVERREKVHTQLFLPMLAMPMRIMARRVSSLMKIMTVFKVCRKQNFELIFRELIYTEYKIREETLCWPLSLAVCSLIG